MPPLPNAVSSSHLPYPPGSNQSVNMSMPMPSRPTQLASQAGFVLPGYVSQPSNALNPNQLPYPTQPTALTPYPRAEQQVPYGGNCMPPNQTTCLSATMANPSNTNQPGNLPSAYPVQANSSFAPPMLPCATQSVPQYGVQFDPNSPHNNLGHFQQTSLSGSAYPNSMGSNFIHRIQVCLLPQVFLLIRFHTDIYNFAGKSNGVSVSSIQSSQRCTSVAKGDERFWNRRKYTNKHHL